jgi:hypothetical protein
MIQTSSFQGGNQQPTRAAEESSPAVQDDAERQGAILPAQTSAIATADDDLYANIPCTD